MVGVDRRGVIIVSERDDRLPFWGGEGHCSSRLLDRLGAAQAIGDIGMGPASAFNGCRASRKDPKEVSRNDIEEEVRGTARDRCDGVGRARKRGGCRWSKRGRQFGPFPPEQRSLREQSRPPTLPGTSLEPSQEWRSAKELRQGLLRVMRTCVQVTSKGSIAGELQRALEKRDVLAVRSLAGEPPSVPLATAAEITVLLLENEPGVLRTAARRLLARLASERAMPLILA